MSPVPYLQIVKGKGCLTISPHFKFYAIPLSSKNISVPAAEVKGIDFSESC